MPRRPWAGVPVQGTISGALRGCGSRRALEIEAGAHAGCPAAHVELAAAPGCHVPRRRFERTTEAPLNDAITKNGFIAKRATKLDKAARGAGPGRWGRATAATPTSRWC